MPTKPHFRIVPLPVCLLGVNYIQTNKLAFSFCVYLVWDSGLWAVLFTFRVVFFPS